MPKITPSVSKAAVTVKKVTVAKSAAAAKPAVETVASVLRPINSAYLQLAYVLVDIGAGASAGGRPDFVIAPANTAIPVPHGPGRMPADWASLRVIDTIRIPEHGVEFDVAVRFRSLS